ncbi:hypothetical protein FOIG_01637 [Fusarium odoratissimum NRRL 54006]|uniref:Uncharacterized protein n=1 Tax=Fusarium odoratissimum (strain NRRL 54006) TaxID=1089451 RepID=X0KII7_FUSO5|nr:uncharacterized protein FOIG_01637 [Fusarium odoratissimum NRRL 54006]EXM08557.1 hypothetical protein FOIG_01637 [Fusarium odoratissimum NRRL 54006]
MYRVLVICFSSLKLKLMGSNRSSNYSKITGVMSNLNPTSEDIGDAAALGDRISNVDSSLTNLQATAPDPSEFLRANSLPQNGSTPSL